jgi:Flp pilus assembly pilin Flp
MDHHALQGRLHAELHHRSRAARRRFAAAQEGQGTVEYVALILLVAAVLAAAVVASNGKSFDLQTEITDQMKKAIEKAGK